MTRYEICHNIFANVKRYGFFGTLGADGSWTLSVADQRRPVIDCHPNGKWRFGDTIGTVPKGHDCVIEGFMVRKGKTVRRGKVTYRPNGSGDVNYILRGNDVA